LPDGETEIARQNLAQFPEGWEKKEEERVQRDAEALKKVTEAIKNAKDGDDCDADIQAFLAYLADENKGKGMFKTGFYLNDQLLTDAKIFFEDNYALFGGDGGHKNDLMGRKVIGGIERYATACLAQAICQDPFRIVVKGEKLRRSLYYRNFRSSHFPLDADPSYILGRDYAGARLPDDEYRESALDINICKAKNTSFANFCVEANSSKSSPYTLFVYGK
jgi:hypothetical protein